MPLEVHRTPPVDLALRRRSDNWPEAWHGDSTWRPARLEPIKITSEGLVVLPIGWWGSAAVLDHQLALAMDVAERLAGRREGAPE